jgi:transposase
MTVTVLAGPERRRRWTTAEKLRIVEESLAAVMSVVEFARRRDLHPNLVHTWRWQVRKGMLSQTSNSEARFAPIAVVPVADAVQPTASETREAVVIEVVLRNTRGISAGFDCCTAGPDAGRGRNGDGKPRLRSQSGRNSAHC